MIYNPTTGEVAAAVHKYRPRTCFLMTQLGKPIPSIVAKIRSKLSRILDDNNYQIIDAGSKVTGRDFLQKIWGLILSVPIGIAIIDKDMKSTTIQNVFYEIGVMQAFGKETIVIKTTGTEVPSDFLRDEYIEHDRHFNSKIKKFLSECEELVKHYEFMADDLKKNPVLSVDYYRRAYLLSGKTSYRSLARTLISSSPKPIECLDCSALERSWF